MPLAPFIVLDGIDGTGKSTQVRLLVEWLRSSGIEALGCTDPGGTPVGDRLRDILLNHRGDIDVRSEALLFMASRAELVSNVIRPALEAGTVVVCDRFLLANVAYQGHGGGLAPDELWRIGRFATGGLEPDLTLVLDLPVAAAEARRGRTADRMEARDLAYRELVRDGFLTEARAKPQRIEVVDAGPTIEDLQAILRRRVGELLRQRGYRLAKETT
jgi:dTMP kinase